MNNDAVEVQLNRRRRRLYGCLKPHLLVPSNLKINLLIIIFLLLLHFGQNHPESSISVFIII